MALHSVIGQRLNIFRRGMVTASFVGIFVVAFDLAFVRWNHYPESIQGRWAMALIVLTAYFMIVQGDLTSLGLRLTPTQGWCYWVRVTLLIAIAVGACIMVGLGAWVLSGRKLPIYATPPGSLGMSFLQMCLFAPILEETIYRLAICVPLAVLLGPWRAIAISGIAFAGLHVAYGNPSPENLVGGFFLAWAYLKSESITIPVLLHSLGNLCVLAMQVVTWYWLRGAF